FFLITTISISALFTYTTLFRSCPSILEQNRKLIFENTENRVRYFWVKPSDVAVYVERGAADVGIVGKDILLEQNAEVYELLDLGDRKSTRLNSSHVSISYAVFC